MFPETAGVDTELMQSLLEASLSGGGQFSELYFEESRSGHIGLEEGIIKTAGRTVFRGLGVRVVIGEQTGYAYTEDLSPAAMKKAALTAAAIARTSSSGTIPPLSVGPTAERYPVALVPEGRNVDEKIALLREAEAAAQASDQRITRVNASFAEMISDVTVATSDGLLLSDTRPMMRFSVEAVSEDGDGRHQGRSSGGGRLGLEYFENVKSATDHGTEAARRALLLLEARNAPAGPMEVILGPAESGILLHESVGHPLEADFNRKGTSAYAGRIGEVVASPLCTVIDDATVTNDRGAIAFDDEGVEGQRTVLIEKGVLKGYMHDRISARFFDTGLTGNGRRESYKFNPIPRMTTTYMEAGTHDPQEIIASTTRGIYCTSFVGGQVDISNGDFVFVPSEAYLVEDGKLTAPVKNLTLIGNGPDVMTRISMVGTDLGISDGMWTCGKGQTVPVGVGLPTVKISEITVGGSAL
jgi:TldD protein